MAKTIVAEELNGFYQDIAYAISVEVAIQMYEHYRGLQVIFPTRLMDPSIIRQHILNEFDGTNYKSLALKYGYSERWVRKIIG